MVSVLDSRLNGPGSSPDRGRSVLFLATQFILTVPLFTQVNKLVPVNLMLGITLRWTSIPAKAGRGAGGGGGIEILQVASCNENWR